MFIKVTKKKYYLGHMVNMTLKTLFLTNSNSVYFFKLLFEFPTANFVSLLRGQPHSLDVNHCVLHFWPEDYRESRNEVGSLSLAKCLVGFKLGSFQFLLCRNPLGQSSQKQCNSQPCRRKRFNFFLMLPRTLNIFCTRNNQTKKIHCTNKTKNVALEK